jgi:hypothetical protein
MKKLILIFTLLFIGCSPERPPLESWKITIKSPSGTKQEYVIKCHGKPIKHIKWSGTIWLRDQYTSTFADWEREIYAPVGWFMIIERNGQWEENQ